ncbi:MAG: DUF4837 family protein [Fidelibacterota bacterium]
MNKNLLFIGIVLTFMLMGCSQQKERPKGSLDVIYVLSSDSTWNKLETAIDTCFSQYGIRTPEFQRFFHVNWYSINKLRVFAHYRNLVVIADLSKKGLGRNLAERILPPDHLELAKQDSVNIFSIDDHYARDQVFLLIAGTDMKKLEQAIIDRKDWIYSKFSKHYRERLKNRFYDNREKKSLARVYYDKYEWLVRIPKKFIPIMDAPDSNFVWLGADLPFRWFSVTWEEGMNTKLMTPNGMMEKRQEIGSYYGDVRSDTTFLSHYYTRLNDWDALKMNGLWFSREMAKGGPFLSYAFYDSHTDRTFLLDMLIYDPSFEKLTDYYRELEIMAKTFSTQYTSDYFK